MRIIYMVIYIIIYGYIYMPGGERWISSINSILVVSPLCWEALLPLKK